MSCVPALVCPPSPTHPGPAFLFSVDRWEEFLNRRSFCSSNTQLCGVPCTHTPSCLTPLCLCTCCSRSLGHPSSPSSADQLLLIRQDPAQAVASSRLSSIPGLNEMHLPGVPAALAWLHYLRTGTGACCPIKVIEMHRGCPDRASACGFAAPRNGERAPVSSCTSDTSRVSSPGACVPKCRGTGPRCQTFFLHLLPPPSPAPTVYSFEVAHVCGGVGQRGSKAGRLRKLSGLQQSPVYPWAYFARRWGKVVSSSQEPWPKGREIWSLTRSLLSSSLCDLGGVTPLTEPQSSRL